MLLRIKILKDHVSGKYYSSRPVVNYLFKDNAVPRNPSDNHL